MIRLAFTCLLAAGALFGQPPEKPAPLKFPFDNSNAIVKYDCTSVIVEPDGKSVSTNHYRVGVYTDRGIREYSQDVSVYSLNYDTIEVVSVKVHLPNGETVDVDTSAIKDVPMPAFGKFFLHNVREKIITFPELVEGAEIEVVTREITREPPMDKEFNWQGAFEHHDPIMAKHVQIVAPESIGLRWMAHGGEIPMTKSSKAGLTTYTWTMSNIPQLVPEPGMPPAPEVYRQLFVSSIDDWETWSKWYDALSEPTMVADDSIRTMVKELTGGKSREEQIKAIFYYVSNQIRYVETALTGRKAGYKPEEAPVTFRNKYGVCRDKAALMVSMLREAGIESDIVLMNPAWKINPDIPVDQFNHAIVAVRNGSEITYIDPTVEKTKDFMAASEQDKAVLVCDDDGEPLRWTPLEPSEKNLYEIRAESHLNDDGTFHSLVTILSTGFPDLILRNWMQSIPPKKREDTFKQIVQQFSPKAQLESFEISDAMDFSKQMEIKFSFSAEDYMIPAGEYALFQVPGQSTSLDFLTSWLLSGSELTTRRFDLRLESTFAVRSEESVTYPLGYKVRSLPEKVDQNHGTFRMAREFTKSGDNRLTVKRVTDFSTLNVALSEYHKLQAMLSEADRMGRGKVVLVKS